MNRKMRAKAVQAQRRAESRGESRASEQKLCDTCGTPTEDHELWLYVGKLPPKEKMN